MTQATLLKIKERNRKAERKHQYSNKAKPMLGHYMAYQYMSLNNSSVIKFFYQLQNSVYMTTVSRDAAHASCTTQNADSEAVDVGRGR